jgi:HAD superfamily phosphoserine phosphatase-like hydrolase
MYRAQQHALTPSAANDTGALAGHKRGTAFAFDLDGTITRAELLPMIASELGLEAEMRLLTELTMSGMIPFEDSFRLRFAILRSAGLDRIQSIVSEVEFDPDIEQFIRENRDRCFVVTGNLDLWIAPLVERLGCRFYTSTATTDKNGWITGLDTVMRKNVAGLELKDEFDRLVAIGDGFNDVPLFDVADIGIAFTGLHGAPDALVSVSNYVALDGKSLCRLLNTL